MKIHILASAAALVFLGTNPALADDFTGPRIEARAGWDHARPATKDPKANGFAYGIAAGYDFAVSKSLILGAEVGVDLFDNDSRLVAGNVTHEASAKCDIEVAARIGHQVGKNFLVYAKAGYSNARFEDVLTVGGTAGTARTVVAENLDGIRVGGGIEARIRDGLYAKTEYRYTNYEQDVSRHQVMVGVGYRF